MPHPGSDVMHAFVSRWIAIAALSTAALAAAPLPVFASDVPVSWSVEPATAAGEPDGHAWLELTLDAGSGAERHLRVTNRGDEAVVFSLSAADGYFTDSGRFTMLPADRTSVDAGTWISLPDSVSVAAHTSAVVPFRVDVPANATPGDHLAGVAAGILSENDAVRVESRVGFRVITRVTGPITPAVTSTATAEYLPSWSPFQPGRLSVHIVTTNSGNTRLNVVDDVTVSGPLGWGAQTRRPEASSEMAPGDVREATVVVDDVWPSFVTTASVTASATGVTDDSETAAAEASVSVPSTPWTQMALGVALLVLLRLVGRDRRRRRDRWQREIEAAREEGRRAAAPAAFVIALALGFAVPMISPTSAEAAGLVPVTVEITPRPDATSSWIPEAAALAATGVGIPDALMLVGIGAVVIGGVSQARRRTSRRRADRPARQAQALEIAGARSCLTRVSRSGSAAGRAGCGGASSA